ncbi:glycosyltransferase family 4 protein [Candidatus Sumerlaeota bacterium]|nr:glycosyltransferase family 4 protein [Candidatus Sumerlaeota bacterium]
MRIGIDARYLNGEFSGIATYSERLIENIAQLDTHNEYVVYVHPGLRRKLNTGANFKIRTYNARAVSLRTMWDFGKFIEPDRLDLLHSHFPLAPITWEGPLLTTVHDLQAITVPDFTARRKWLVRKLYDLFYRFAYPVTIKRSRYIIAVSKATAHEIATLFPEKAHDTIVTHSGLDESYFVPPDPQVEEETIEKLGLPPYFVLYIGSTRPNKNLPNMIRAFGKVIEHSQNLKNDVLNNLNLVLIINPDRFFAPCRELIKRLGISDRVSIYRQLSEEQIKVFYRRARLLSFVTKNEGFGFPMLEAQACGTPVLAANHGALPEIANGSTLIVDPDDVDDITGGLIRLLINDSLIEQCRKAGLANARRYTWKSAAERVHEIYENLF